MSSAVIPAYVINLPEEIHHFEGVSHQLAAFGCEEIVRVSGVRGALIPDVACRTLTGNKWSVNHKGTLGCFLAHMRAWELIAGGDAACGLILEDDVQLQHLDKLRDAEFPLDCDLLWCNGRTAYPVAIETTFRPMFPALAYVEEHGHAIGGDCYVLTREGARNLLSYVETDGFFTHVDLRLMAYSLTMEEGQASRGAGTISRCVADLRATYAAQHKLGAYSFWPPISSHLFSPSRRAAEDRLGERPLI